ncbi:helix-turn-helix transcriptional regulator [Selenomonas sputigena]|uniref:Helix-turn-helix transcriptional regulator n=1 Tax=Selenomonas sputigena TaxID=69823 RepID=A0ABV3X425_9FIRM
MDDLDRYLDEQLKNPEFKKEWEAHELEYQLTMLLLKERRRQRLTQTELATRSGLRQSNISRIEKGQASPTLSTLNKIAYGLGKKIQIRFV